MQLATNRQGFAPATLDEAMRFSDMLANSSMVPKAYQGKPQDILVCVQWGYEMGLAPMQALQNIAVINGKPSVYGDAAMALVQASSVCEDIEEYFEGEGTPNPIAVCVAKRKGRKPVVAKFSVEDAKRAGLWGKQGPWTAYPKRMMQMRARGFALRDAFPDVLKGLITAEEAQDYPTEELSLNSAGNKRQVKANPLDAIAPPQPVDVIEQANAEVQLSAAELREEFEDAGIEVVEVEEVTEEVPIGPKPGVPGSMDVRDMPGYHLMLPGHNLPHSVFKKAEEWQDAYENMADAVCRAGKVEPRERMTKLRELREANEDTLKRIDPAARLRHTASYSKRLKALGASQ